jgi:alanyl-tRNA synthetase
LQNLANGASQALPQMPNLGNWVAPTLNEEELEKRIAELKAVHFWLDQNSRALGATVQALEVQKMTLAALKGMNFNMGELANAFKLKTTETTETVVAGVQKVTEKASATAKAKTVADAAAHTEEVVKMVGNTAKPVAAAAAAGMGDPLQLWSALTQQFQQIAASAMKEAGKATAVDLSKNLVKGVAPGVVAQVGKVAKNEVVEPAKKGPAAKKTAKKSTSSSVAEGAMQRRT